MPYRVFWAFSLGSYGLLIKSSHPRGSQNVRPPDAEANRSCQTDLIVNRTQHYSNGKTSLSCASQWIPHVGCLLSQTQKYVFLVSFRTCCFIEVIHSQTCERQLT